MIWDRQLVDRIVQSLDLTRNLIDLAAGFVLSLDLLLQGIDGLGHAVDAVGCLLDQMLEHAHALIV